MVGSITLLLSFLALFLASGSFDFIELTQMAQTGQLAAAIGQNLHWHQWDSGHITMFLFCGAFLGFAVKTPVVPFHGWLASAYAEAAPETTMVADRRFVEDGRVWVSQDPAAHFPGADVARADRSSLVGHRQHRAARIHCLGANRLEENVCLLFDQPPGILHSGHRCGGGLYRSGCQPR